MFGEKGFLAKLAVTKVADFIVNLISKPPANGSNYEIEIGKFREMMLQELSTSNKKIDNLEVVLDQTIQLLYLVVNNLSNTSETHATFQGDTTINIFFALPQQYGTDQISQLVQKEAIQVFDIDTIIDQELEVVKSAKDDTLNDYLREARKRGTLTAMKEEKILDVIHRSVYGE